MSGFPAAPARLLLDANRTASGSGTWQLVDEGTVRLHTDKGGKVDLLRTWYTLTENRKFPAGSGKDVDLVYIWVKE